jgi:hypothetical protein
MYVYQECVYIDSSCAKMNKICMKLICIINDKKICIINIACVRRTHSNTGNLFTCACPRVGACTSLTHTHRLISFCNPTQPLANSARLMHKSVSDSKLSAVSLTSRDSACEPALSPTVLPAPRSSLTHAHRSIGFRNPTQRLAKSARLMYLSVSALHLVCEGLGHPQASSSI